MSSFFKQKLYKLFRACSTNVHQHACKYSYILLFFNLNHFTLQLLHIDMYEQLYNPKHKNSEFKINRLDLLKVTGPQH